MTRTQGYGTLAALCILAAASAHADVLHVNFTNHDPTYPQFGSLSFDIDTTLPVDTLNTGTCGEGSVSSVYQTAQFSGGVSNAILVYNSVTYTLQSSTMYLEENFGSCSYYLNMNLTFNNGTAFSTQDQPTGGPYFYADYNPSQLLATALIGGYDNRYMNAAHLYVPGQGTPDAFSATVTAVP